MSVKKFGRFMNFAAKIEHENVRANQQAEENVVMELIKKSKDGFTDFDQRVTDHSLK
jgi:hypothetical protein